MLQVSLMSNAFNSCLSFLPGASAKMARKHELWVHVAHADMDPIPELEAQPEDVAEACLLPFKMSGNAMPIELTISTCKNYKK